jgi:hypothetical protein
MIHSVISLDFFRDAGIESSQTRAVEQIPQGDECLRQVHGHEEHACEMMYVWHLHAKYKSQRRREKASRDLRILALRLDG